ncbi:hypothetical protein KKD42_00965 [Patescibacteria group bacterium]|nr:hypothetical protein [Patescibacteria group bacterium]
MNRLLVFFGIVLSFFGMACGSSVLIEGGDQITTGGGSGGSGTTETSTDTGTGGVGGQVLPPELTVSYMGPTSDKLPIGVAAHLFDFTLMAESHKLSINSLEFVLKSIDGGFLVGSSGTAYFSNFKILDVDGNEIMGPIGLSLAAGETATTVSFDEGLVLPPGILVPGKPNLFRLVADLDATEDSSGEFIGRKYFVSLQPFAQNEVIDQETGLPLEPEQITPQDALNGEPLTVVAP